MEHFLSQVEVGYQFSVISFNSQPVAALRQAQGPVVEALQPLVAEPVEALQPLVSAPRQAR
ncbi:hypothetical protein [Fibrobacter intestinalis]|nr:hypothetical protein [Fibrobacter sp. NR9]